MIVYASPGLGYNSISEGNTKCDVADCLAILRPTFTGYVRLFIER